MIDPTVRRSAVATLGGRDYQVTEPNPSKSYRVINWCCRILGPILAQILSGQLIDRDGAVCPNCGAKDQALTVDKQWLCKAPHAKEQDRACGTMWDQVVRKGADGKPARVTLEYALGDPRWKVLLGAKLADALERLDVDDSEAFMHEVLLGNLSVNSFGSWIPIETIDVLDHHIPSGSIVAQLMKAAMSAWVLPSLADGLNTPPASSAEQTSGASEAATPPPRPRSPGPPPVQTAQ